MFVVEITETLTRRVAVDVDNNVDAVAKAKAWYRDGDIVLGAEDYIDTEINCIGIANLEQLATLQIIQ